MATSIPLPPAMADVQSKTVEELAKEFNKIPLFMTHLPEPDAESSNVALEGLRALAYEGTRSQVAGNFREQGNEYARAKNWKDAKEFYDKALAALSGPQGEPAENEGEFVKINEEEEAKKEKDLKEVCLANRALCNLELKNYRSCILDCAATLKLNEKNTKAWFRSASACLALEKIDDAKDACERGLETDGKNSALLALKQKISKREEELNKIQARRRDREERETREKNIMSNAFKQRNIHVRKTAKPPDMDDAVPKLNDSVDPSSTLSVPVLFLYPLAEQTDLIKQFEENHSLNDHLAYLLPVPWDKDNEYMQETIDCYIGTSTGGLVKAGKKLPLRKIFETGKVEMVDGMLQIYIVPTSRAQSWINTYKERMKKT